MRPSLISRDVISDSIELVTRGNLLTGLIFWAGFRLKTHFQRRHGPARLQYRA